MGAGLFIPVPTRWFISMGAGLPTPIIIVTGMATGLFIPMALGYSFL